WVPAARVRTRHDIDVELRAPDPFAVARGRDADAAWRDAGPASAAARASRAARPLIDRRGHGISAVCGELLAAGESVLAVCADARRRADGPAPSRARPATGEPAGAA